MIFGDVHPLSYWDVLSQPAAQAMGPNQPDMGPLSPQSDSDSDMSSPALPTAWLALARGLVGVEDRALQRSHDEDLMISGKVQLITSFFKHFNDQKTS